MKKFIHKYKGFITGFLVCALFAATVSGAEGVWENIGVKKNSVNISLDGAPISVDSFMYNDTTYVPLRAFSNAVGLAVSYDAATNTAKIVDKQVAQLMDKAVAFVVNGNMAVRVNYFTQMLNWYKLNSGLGDPISREQWAEFKDFVKNETISMKITEQMADEMGIYLSYKEREAINEKINIFAENWGGLDSFTDVLESYGITYDFYYSLQENAALRDLLTDALIEPVTEDDCQKYYRDNVSAYKTEKITAKHILIKTTDDLGYPLSSSVKAERKEKIDQIYSDIKSGKISFDEAMFKYSEDSGLQFAPNGYTFGRGEMNAVFENEAFSLKAGEMSRVFESESGYHIVLVTARNTVTEDYSKVRDSIYNSIRNSRYYKTVEPQISGAYILVNELVYNNL